MAKTEGMHCWMFPLFRPKLSFTDSRIVYGGSLQDNTGGRLGRTLLCTSDRKLSRCITKQMFQAYKQSTGINLKNGQGIVFAWSKYGIISRK
jgi:hypothetical protein